MYGKHDIAYDVIVDDSRDEPGICKKTLLFYNMVHYCRYYVSFLSTQ